MLSLQAQGLGVEVDLVFEVLEGLQRQVEEVATAACGVEYLELTQLLQEAAEQGLCLALSLIGPCAYLAELLRVLDRLGRLAQLVALGQLVGDARRDVRPLGLQWVLNDGLDDAPDRGGVGVVSAELGPLAGVQAALE